MKFKKGDKVKIREDSSYYGIHIYHNPINQIGIIKGIDARCGETCWGIRVEWPNGKNSYNPEDLIRYNGIKPIKYIMKHEI
jgi:hypothetical protein